MDAELTERRHQLEDVVYKVLYFKYNQLKPRNKIIEPLLKLYDAGDNSLIVYLPRIFI